MQVSEPERSTSTLSGSFGPSSKGQPSSPRAKNPVPGASAGSGSGSSGGGGGRGAGGGVAGAVAGLRSALSMSFRKDSLGLRAAGSFTTASSPSYMAESHDCITVFFSDIVGFSRCVTPSHAQFHTVLSHPLTPSLPHPPFLFSWAHSLPPHKVMAKLNELYSMFDDILTDEFKALYKASLTSSLIITCRLKNNAQVAHIFV